MFRLPSGAMPTSVFSPVSRLDLGAVQCAWGAHRHALRAETVLRPWLAAALRTDAATLPLDRDANGRPRFGAPLADADASWSHSGDALLVALGRGIAVGADLERLRPRPRALALAERFFTATEAAALAAMPAAHREVAFVALWCAKEAVLKAHGRGLVFGLHRLEFAFDGDRWRLVACDRELGAPDDWTLHAFAPMPGYVAAIAWRARETAS